jgi:uncharacterized membrane protein
LKPMNAKVLLVGESWVSSSKAKEGSETFGHAERSSAAGGRNLWGWSDCGLDIRYRAALVP